MKNIIHPFLVTTTLAACFVAPNAFAHPHDTQKIPTQDVGTIEIIAVDADTGKVKTVEIVEIDGEASEVAAATSAPKVDAAETVGTKTVKIVTIETQTADAQSGSVDMSGIEAEKPEIPKQVTADVVSVEQAPAEAPKKANSEFTQALQQIQPLSQSEVKNLQNKLPNFNGVMRDMVSLANSEDMRGHFEKGVARIEETVDIDSFMDTEDGLPDINGLVSAMISLLGDEEFVGEIKAGLEPVAETMEKYIPED